MYPASIFMAVAQQQMVNGNRTGGRNPLLGPPVRAVGTFDPVTYVRPVACSFDPVVFVRGASISTSAPKSLDAIWLDNEQERFP